MIQVIILVIGILAVTAIVGWWRAWRLSQPSTATRTQPRSKGSDLDKSGQQAAEQINDSIEQASELFQKNLTVQALRINDELEGIAGQRLHKQVEDFTATMDGLTATATASVAQLQSLVDQRRKTLEASMTTQILDEQQRAIERFYTRLSDMVASYIIDSLGNEIDLSGQLPFVLKVLEQNKDNIRKDLVGED